MEGNQAIFTDITPEQNVVEIESLCMNCHEKGVSRFLLTRVPHFRDIVISAFECAHCGAHNNKVESASTIGEKGIRETCLVTTSEARTHAYPIVVSEHASIILDNINLEKPPNREKGFLNTIEGIIRHIRDDLIEGQEHRKAGDVESFEKIQDVIRQLDEMLELKLKCIFIVDDPSGNSYIENLLAPKNDPKLKKLYYTQSKEQLESMGFYQNQEQDAEESQEAPESVYVFPSNCSSCSAPSETRMHMLEIPHFREVIIMATTCDMCGYKSNEVKSGGAISRHGKRIQLMISSEEDLNRDILKSETCTLEIPEIDLQLTTGALGGRFTTLEGLLRQVYDEIKTKLPFDSGDSSLPSRRNAVKQVLDNIDLICQSKLHCNIILDDPLANSYLQNIYAPDPDPNLTITEYERSFEQNEDLGLNDIKTENYS